MNLSSFILNDIEHTLKMKYTNIQNTTEEQTVQQFWFVIQIIHRMLGKC